MNSDEQMIKRTVGAMKKSGKLWVALAGVAIGVGLLLFGGQVDLSGQDGDTDEAVPGVGETRLSMEEYRTALEARICTVCARVEGVGQVYAVVTLEGGFEYVYATDRRSTSSGESSEYIIIGSGDGERLVYLTERVPSIMGIGVVCTGGNDATVRREVTGLLSAAFGVGSNKIYVTGGG